MIIAWGPYEVTLELKGSHGASLRSLYVKRGSPPVNHRRLQGGHLWSYKNHSGLWRGPFEPEGPERNNWDLRRVI